MTRTAPVKVYPNGFQKDAPDYGAVIERRPVVATCLWCKQDLVDGSKESGWTGEGPDYMIDGDFGCGDSPDTGDDGTGSHTPDEFETKDGHLVRIDSYTHIRALWPEREKAEAAEKAAADLAQEYVETRP